MRIAAAVLVLCVVSLPAIGAFDEQATRTPAQQSASAKVAASIEQTGLKYRKASDAIWAVTFESRGAAPIDVIVNGQNELVIVLAVVARKPALSAAQLAGMLRVSYDANFSKIAIDSDGDLLALAELSASSLTPASLRNAIEQVASAAESAAKQLGAAPPAAAPPPAPSPSLAPRSDGYPAVPAGTGATLQLLRGAYEVSYDPRKWTRQEARESNVIQMSHVSGDAYVRIIAERIQIDPDHLREVALTNARTTAPDVQLDSETWRTTNGLRTLLVRYTGRASGIRFTFLNQMFSDPNGTVQLAAWTGTNLFDEYQRDFLELFSGFRKVQ